MKKILIIESDPSLANEIVSLIQSADLGGAFSVANGKEGLSFCQAEKPDLIVLNMSLPDFHGLEFPEGLAAKKEIYGEPAILLLWDFFFSLPDKSFLDKKFQIKHCIQKPCPPAQIIEGVRQILGLKNAEVGPVQNIFEQFPTEYIQVFVESATNFFTTMVDIHPKVAPFYLKNDPFSQSDISGRMEITGGLEGTVCLSFEKKMALQVVSNMLGEKFESIDDVVRDAVGEATNIITGNAKKYFSEKGMPFIIGLPKVFVGKFIAHKLAPKIPCVVIPFLSPFGSFFIEICVNIKRS